jgi:hypothetical protein
MYINSVCLIFVVVFIVCLKRYPKLTLIPKGGYLYVNHNFIIVKYIIFKINKVG